MSDIENLRASFESACDDIKQRDAEIARLRSLLYRWHVWGGYEGHDLAEETRDTLEGK